MRGATKLPNIIGYHDVADVDHWLSSDMREKGSGRWASRTSAPTSTRPTPSASPISADVPDVDALVAYLQSEDGAAAAASDGVALETVVLLVEARP
jgi:hypothetical protein